jgi:hypothetical protein
VCIDRAPTDSEQKTTLPARRALQAGGEEKKVSFRRIYNLRFLSLLLFKISAPSVLSAVKSIPDQRHFIHDIVAADLGIMHADFSVCGQASRFDRFSVGIGVGDVLA